MKRIFILLLIPLLALFGCKQEEIVFDHEKPAFETKDGMILLEVIAPTETLADDAIYISGAFNGSDDEAAAENPLWQLEKSTKVAGKWGIYLDPKTFVDGKTLADGYRFISVASGEERTALNKTVSRDLNPQPGTRTNIFVTHWAAFFEKVEVITHDGYAIYIQDETGWGDIALYCWGDAEVFGAWPGILPTGKEKINGREYTYFDCGANNAGAVVNLIFNNNNGGSQIENFDALKSVTLNKNYFFSISAESVELLDIEQTYKIYVENRQGWDAVALYAWGDAEIFGAWPGAQPTGTVVMNGVTYSCFDVPADAAGKSENLIFNNNNGGEQAGDYALTMEAHDYYFTISDKTATEVIPFSYTGGDVTPEPEPEPEPEPDPEAKEVNVYVVNNSGWEPAYLYCWGDAEAFGAWPGAAPSGSVSIAQTTYSYYTVAAENYGKSVSLIFNNNNGAQFDGEKITLDKDYFYSITNTAATSLSVPETKIYIINNSGWGTPYLYCWGDAEAFGAWPGAAPSGTETIGGTEYSYYSVGADFFGKEVHLIFNNNEGTQYDGPVIKLNSDYYYTITATEATPNN